MSTLTVTARCECAHRDDPTPCEGSPTAVRVTRRLIRGAVEASEAEGWRQTFEAAAEVGASGDGIEGAKAFLEKREPVWHEPA